VQRPFVFINSAMSLDGKISNIQRRQVRISGKADLSRVDALRASADAIMVGIGTVIADDPKLRVKSENLRKARIEQGKKENPYRVIVDSNARTPTNAQVLGDGCMIAVSKAAPPNVVAKLSDKCEIVTVGDYKIDLIELMEMLHAKGLKRLMVEGGATLNFSLMKEKLVDEIYIYIGNMLIGGESAPSLMDGEGYSANFPKLELISLDRLDEGVFLRWRVCDAL
jgi:2,5-diamino-6-(ribosylamino)-4(3H)-pyrimidinone 5'-phosphate reductase